MVKKFPIGKPVSGKDLIGREEEINQIFELLKDGHSVILIAPRRFGKTSIILEVLRKLQIANFLVGDIDIFDITSKRELAEKIIETTLNNDNLPLTRLFKSMKENVVKALQQVEFKSVINEYEFILGFSDKQKTDEELLDDALNFPQEYASKKGKSFIMAFDEFSDLVKLNGEALIKKMRAKFQRQSQIVSVQVV